MAKATDGKNAELVIVANRLPVRRVKEGGSSRWATSPGGLVSAVMPALRERHAGTGGGAWIGWSGDASKQLEPFEHEQVRMVPVPVDRKELSEYYDGLSNQTLWPLYHDVIRPPVYRRSWFRGYQKINERFAEAAANTVAKGGTVWVHDYHLHLVPGMLRERRPDVRIGFFLHIPFPGRGLFAQLPWREQILKGTLGSDVIGMQTKLGARNFVDLACWYAGAKQSAGGVEIEGRHVRVDCFPISVDTDRFTELSQRPDVIERAEEFRRRLDHRKVLLGVDRMDYTKGIDTRLLAFQELLRSKKASASDVVMVQSAVPTREDVSDYSDLRSRIEELVGQVNGEFGEVGRIAVQYLRQNLQVEELVALYLIADVMVVTPLRDGMNLIAKEWVASRNDLTGAMVLSEFTGAAAELPSAIIVNPHDRDGVVRALEQAIKMDPEEQAQRLRKMRRTVKRHDVHAWAKDFLESVTG